MAASLIQVENLDHIRRGLRQIDSDLGRVLGQKNKAVAALVGRLAQRKKSQLAGRFPSYESRAVKISPSANQRRVQVTVRPAAAEWGATVHPVFGRFQSQASFRRKVWPGWGREGFLIRPTVTENEREIAQEYLEAVSRLARQVIGD